MIAQKRTGWADAAKASGSCSAKMMSGEEEVMEVVMVVVVVVCDGIVVVNDV
jgi:hypothetical protein